MTSRNNKNFEWTITEYVELMTKLDRIDREIRPLTKILSVLDDHEKRITKLENKNKPVQSYWWQNQQLVKSVVYLLTALGSLIAIYIGTQ